MRQVVMKMASAIFHIYISYFFPFASVLLFFCVDTTRVQCGNNKITHKNKKNNTNVCKLNYKSFVLTVEQLGAIHVSCQYKTNFFYFSIFLCIRFVFLLGIFTLENYMIPFFFGLVKKSNVICFRVTIFSSRPSRFILYKCDICVSVLFFLFFF